jgi:hypothetical protein
VPEICENTGWNFFPDVAGPVALMIAVRHEREPLNIAVPPFKVNYAVHNEVNLIQSTVYLII